MLPDPTENRDAILRSTYNTIAWANTDMSDFTSHSSSDNPARQPRGSYAKLICLNCRARKIKCNLPTDLQIEPSHFPQSSERACTRCQQQGLDCIVDKTVLGRPAQKRRRPEQPKAEEESLAGDGAIDEAEIDPNVQFFVLSDLRDGVDEIDVQVTTNARPRPSKREVFESLMDSTHLFSALMARDATFGSLVFETGVEVNMDVTRLVGESTTMLMDEQYVKTAFEIDYCVCGLLTRLQSGLATFTFSVYAHIAGTPSDIIDRDRSTVCISNKCSLSFTLPDSVGHSLESTPSLNISTPAASGPVELALPNTAIQHPEA